jgi:hypothetical protein
MLKVVLGRRNLASDVSSLSGEIMRVLGWMVASGMVAAAAGLSAQQGRHGAESVTIFPAVTMTITPACPVGFHAAIDP